FPESSRNDVGGPHAGGETIAHEVGAVEGFGGQHHHVRECAEGETAPEGVPLHGGDYRDVALQQEVEEVRIRELKSTIGEREEFLARAAAAEVVAKTVNDDDLERGIRANGGEDLDQSFHEGP